MGFVEFLKTLFSLSFEPVPASKLVPICPNCQKELEETSFSGGRLSRCGDCEGLWVDEDSFGLLLDLEPEQAEPLYGKPTSGHTYNRSAQARICPSCDHCLDNYQFAYDSGIWLDACPYRHGVWLDGGELKLCRACKQALAREASTEEKYRASLGLLEGATTARGNLAEIQHKVQAEWQRQQQQVYPSEDQ